MPRKSNKLSDEQLATLARLIRTKIPIWCSSDANHKNNYVLGNLWDELSVLMGVDSKQLIFF